MSHWSAFTQSLSLHQLVKRLYLWKNLTPFLLALMVSILSLSLVACAGANPPPLNPGDVAAIHTGTSVWVLSQWYSGARQTFAMIHPLTKNAWFAAPLDNLEGWGTVALNMAKKEPLVDWLLCGSAKGTYFGCSSMADMVNTALENGWEYYFPKDASPEFPKWLTTASSWIMRSLSAANQITILVVPFGAFDFSILPTPIVR